METEKRLIDANAALLNTYNEVFWSESEAAAVRSFLVQQKTVDAVEVVHGHWEHENCDIFHCSVCGYVDAFPHMDEGIRPHKYCPDCGAKMDGGVDDGI